ncbi:hypothetical protein M3J09_000956 [Ascochyta lentis]
MSHNVRSIGFPRRFLASAVPCIMVLTDVCASTPAVELRDLRIKFYNGSEHKSIRQERLRHLVYSRLQIDVWRSMHRTVHCEKESFSVFFSSRIARTSPLLLVMGYEHGISSFLTSTCNCPLGEPPNNIHDRLWPTQHRHMIPINHCNLKPCAFLIKITLCKRRAHTVVMLSNYIQSPKAAVVGNVSPRSVECFETRWQQLRSPVIGCGCIEEVVESQRGRVSDEILVPCYQRRRAVERDVVVEEGGADDTYVGTGRVVVDFGDGGNISRELRLSVLWYHR